MGRDPARGLGTDQLSLGLSRKPEALADRRPADPQYADAALPGGLLSEHCRQPGRDFPAPITRRVRRSAPPAPSTASSAPPRSSRCSRAGLHEFITTFIRDNNRVGSAISAQTWCRPSMRIRVHHETAYTYERPAQSVIQILRLTPRDHEGQYVRRWRIDLDHGGVLRQREDAFGNIMHVLSASGEFSQFSLSVDGEVETRTPPAWSAAPPSISRRSSIYARPPSPSPMPRSSISRGRLPARPRTARSIACTSCWSSCTTTCPSKSAPPIPGPRRSKPSSPAAGSART